MNTRRLQHVHDDLVRLSVDPIDYDGELREAAFEITTVDTFVAGIAATLLRGGKLDAAHRPVLERDYLVGSHWTLADGSRVELSARPELFVFAGLVEELRRECLRCLGD